MKISCVTLSKQHHFSGQNADLPLSSHKPLQVQSAHICQGRLARFLLRHFARCPDLFTTSSAQSVITCRPLSALVAIAAENSLLFMAYGATQRLVSRMAKVEEEELGVLGHGLAGGPAGFWPHLFISCLTKSDECS